MLLKVRLSSFTDHCELPGTLNVKDTSRWLFSRERYCIDVLFVPENNNPELFTGIQARISAHYSPAIQRHALQRPPRWLHLCLLSAPFPPSSVF